MKKLSILLILLSSVNLNAQVLPDSSRTFRAMGTEADVLPYMTGGYYGSVWYATGHLRYRAVVTRVTTPDFMLKDQFTDNRMMVYTLLADYFFRPYARGWWLGGGFEYWDAEIRTELKRETAGYQSYIATLGGGYVWRFWKGFYLNPWGAVHYRIGGDQEVAVDRQMFRPARFVPEGSLKLGWMIRLNKR